MFGGRTTPGVVGQPTLMYIESRRFSQSMRSSVVNSCRCMWGLLVTQTVCDIRGEFIGARINQVKSKP